MFEPAPAAPRVEARRIAPNLTDRHPAPGRGHGRGRGRGGACAPCSTTISAPTGRDVAWYYTPMMLPFSRHLRGRLHRLRLHGRAAPISASPRRGCSSSSASCSSAPTSSSPAAIRCTRPSSSAIRTSIPSRRRSTSPISPRRARDSADDQADRGRRFGFYGVIDERFDLDLLAAIADARPDWRFVMVGPVVKIAPDELPQARQHPSIWAAATYDELPG